MAENLDERLADYIRRKGLKHTRQRDVILQAFLAFEGHVSVDQLLAAAQARDPKIGHATVYRTLRLFADAGIAHVRHFGDGRTLYEPLMKGEHHDHLLCLTCGHIFEFEDPDIEERQREIAQRHGLEITSHRHEIMGECRNPKSCVHFRG